MKKLAFLLCLAVWAVACENGGPEGTAAGDIDYIEFLRYDNGEAAGAHSKIVYTPSFDAKGRLTKSLEQWYFSDHETGKLAANQYYVTSFTYDDAKNTVTYERGNGYWDYSASTPGWSVPEVSESGTLPLNSDGFVTAWADRKATFTYKDGFLDIYESDKDSDYWWKECTYVWKDGDLQKISVRNNRTPYDAYTFTYTGTLNPFGCYDIISSGLCGWIDGEIGHWAAGLFGQHSKHLIKTESDENGTVNYTYKKDKSGRISEVRRADGEAVGGPVGGVFKIHWK